MSMTPETLADLRQLMDADPDMPIGQETVRALLTELEAARRVAEAADYVIRDLEMRSNLKRGEDKGLVDIGDGAYTQAKSALAAYKEATK